MSSGFVSETELAEKRRTRQEEWEKVRQPNQPTEVPDEPYDHRSLFDRLEEQKQKKQHEFEEAHKLKNMIKGLDDDEVQFLDLVDRKKLEAEQMKDLEEQKELLEFRKKVEELKTQNLDQRIQLEKRPTKPTNPVSCAAKSQHQLLKGAVVTRKTIGIAQNNIEPKKAKLDANRIVGEEKVKQCCAQKRKLKDMEEGCAGAKPSSLRCIGILPSLCNYEESSDESDHSCSSSSDVETDNTKYDLVGRKILYKSKHETT